jgi:hypothetical protein
VEVPGIEPGYRRGPQAVFLTGLAIHPLGVGPRTVGDSAGARVERPVDQKGGSSSSATGAEADAPADSSGASLPVSQRSAFSAFSGAL